MCGHSSGSSGVLHTAMLQLPSCNGNRETKVVEKYGAIGHNLRLPVGALLPPAATEAWCLEYVGLSTLAAARLHRLYDTCG